jgi:hypothetical protein
MRIRLISLLVFFATGCISSIAQVTLTDGDDSGILVNGHNPVLTVTSPVDGAVASIDSSCSGPCIYTVEFTADVDSFSLGAQTPGNGPCGGSALRSGPEIAGVVPKGGGQALYVIVDNGAARLVPSTSLPSHIPLPSVTPGPHTMRVCMIRSWDESVKDIGTISPNRQTSLYTVLTFYVDTNTGTHAIDTTKPLLMPNAPLDTNTFVYHPDSVILDFSVMFKEMADDYKVEATIYDSTMSVKGCDTLGSCGPRCVGNLEEPEVGHLRKYFVRMRLLDSGGTPVTNGPGNFNSRTWAFWVRRR